MAFMIRSLHPIAPSVKDKHFKPAGFNARMEPPEHPRPHGRDRVGFWQGQSRMATKIPLLTGRGGGRWRGILLAKAFGVAHSRAPNFTCDLRVHEACEAAAFSRQLSLE